MNYINVQSRIPARSEKVAMVLHTFLLGECITGAGGEGGPRGIFLLILNN